MNNASDSEWARFCNSTLKAHETKWTKKLEDYDHSEPAKEAVPEAKEEDLGETSPPLNEFQAPRSSERGRKNRGGSRYVTSSEDQT